MMRALLAAAVLTLPVVVRAQSWERFEGQHSGVKKALAVAVKDEGQWRDIWHRHDASSPAPDVDFSKESVVLVFLGDKPTAGVKVNVVVQQDPIDATRLNVFYREVEAKSAVSAQVVCQPYAIVKVRRAETIDIEKDGVAKTPEKNSAPAARPDARRIQALLEELLAPTFK